MDDHQLEKRFDRIEKNIEDLIEIVVAVKDNMATKADLDETNSSVGSLKASLDSFKAETANNFEIVNGKIDGIRRWMDIEVEERKKLEDRVSKVEEIVRP